MCLLVIVLNYIFLIFLIKPDRRYSAPTLNLFYSFLCIFYKGLIAEKQAWKYVTFIALKYYQAVALTF